jgi:hypothetical protein
MRWTEHVARMGERRGAYGILVERHERRPFRRLRRRWVFKKWDGGAWPGLIWLRKGTCGGLLWKRYWTSGFHKMRGISWPSEELLASQEGLCSMELVIPRQNTRWSWQQIGKDTQGTILAYSHVLPHYWTTGTEDSASFISWTQSRSIATHYIRNSCLPILRWSIYKAQR